MAGHIIPFHGDPHQEMDSLLPWYATGQLDPSERARVEAHLAVCPECAAELRSERRLSAEIARLPVDIEPSWERLRSRLQAGPRALGWRGVAVRTVKNAWRLGAPWLGWVVAAQILLVMLAVGLQPSSKQDAPYRTLGGRSVPLSGNVVVIFRPDTTESRLRQTLESSQARLVDGPTSAGAYVLNVPSAERAVELAKLRGRPEIELAEPIDSGGPS